jgi:hypothetical protein
MWPLQGQRLDSARGKSPTLTPEQVAAQTPALRAQRRGHPSLHVVLDGRVEVMAASVTQRPSSRSGFCVNVIDVAANYVDTVSDDRPNRLFGVGVWPLVPIAVSPTYNQQVRESLSESHGPVPCSARIAARERSAGNERRVIDARSVTPYL